jgi:hypothetical protein
MVGKQAGRVQAAPFPRETWLPMEPVRSSAFRRRSFAEYAQESPEWRLQSLRGRLTTEHKPPSLGARFKAEDRRKAPGRDLLLWACEIGRADQDEVRNPPALPPGGQSHRTGCSRFLSSHRRSGFQPRSPGFQADMHGREKILEIVRVSILSLCSDCCRIHPPVRLFRYFISTPIDGKRNDAGRKMVDRSAPRGVLPVRE